MVNNHGDRKPPSCGGTPSKWPKWFVNRGYSPLTNWDDPPSIHPGKLTAFEPKVMEFWMVQMIFRISSIGQLDDF